MLDSIQGQGPATVSADDPLRDPWLEAELVVRVSVAELWQNCRRYVPRDDAETPLCEWKRIEGMGGALRPHELERGELAGNIATGLMGRAHRQR